ncbi:hypothetical protein C8Q72DRAFT_889550 [Fomitopsis betulina]|nr:hypothetical protein C8Q72DRAFT_889550 [Fomitopsis betulina]
MITRIPEDAILDDLTSLLQGYGECVVNMRADTEGRNRGYAHAVFRRLRDAQKVMREHIANPFCIGEQTLRMLYSDKGINITLFPRPETVQTIWVSNIPYDAINKELEVLFKPYGLIRRLNMPRKPNGQLAGYAHVQYEYPEEAGSALLACRYRPYTLRGRTLWVMPAKTESGASSVVPLRVPEGDRRVIDADGPHPTFPPSRFLWVGALRRSVRRRDISKMFEPICGPENIVNIHIVRLQISGAGAFAHVELRTRNVAEKLMGRHRRRPFSVFVGERMNVLLDFAAPLIADHEPFYTLFTPFVRGDEMDVQTLFGPHARHIRKIEFHSRPVVDPSGRAAFIEFFTTFQATAAKQAMDQKAINNNTRLTLVYAKRPPLKGPRRLANGKAPSPPPLSFPSDKSSEVLDVGGPEDAPEVISPP